MTPCGSIGVVQGCCEFHAQEDEKNRQADEAISNYRAAEIRRQDVLLEHGSADRFAEGRARDRVLSDIDDRRTAQDEQYGQHNDTLGPDGWLAVLAREFCEAGNEANEHYKGRARSTDKLRAELVDVAAVAVAWIEAIDRKAAGE